MHIQDREKVGTREFSAIIIITIASKFSDMTPTMLAQAGENVSWMIPVISLLIMIVPLYVTFLLLRHYKDKNLIEVIMTILGKPLGLLITLVLFLTSFAANVIDTRGYIEIIGTMYYPNSPVFLIYMVFMIGTFSLAKQGFTGIARVSWSLFPYLKIPLALLLFLVSDDLIFSRLFPFLGPGIETIAKEGFLKNSIYGELIFFGMIYPYIRNVNSYKRSMIIGSSITLFELVIYYLAFNMLFDFPTIKQVTYPFHELTRYATIGDYVTNTETVYFAFWLLGSVIKYAVYLFILVLIFASMCNIKDYKKLLPLFSVLVIGVGLIPENSVELLKMRELLLNTVAFILPAIPLLLWSVAKMRGEFKREEKNNRSI